VQFGSSCRPALSLQGDSWAALIGESFRLLLADFVAKVFLHHRSKIFRAVGVAIEY
jgi:hypothetical protein